MSWTSVIDASPTSNRFFAWSLCLPIASTSALAAAKAEVEAIGRQRDQAKKRFDVGLASITEVQDTQAAYDLSVVGRITREAQLDSSREALSAIIGGNLPLLSPLTDDYPTPPPDPIDLSLIHI